MIQRLTKADIKPMTKEEAQAFIRRVMGLPKRTLEGKEREQILTMLALVEPTRTSNNQHSWSEDYMQGGRHWSITYFPNEDPIVDEIEINSEEVARTE